MLNLFKPSLAGILSNLDSTVKKLYAHADAATAKAIKADEAATGLLLEAAALDAEAAKALRVAGRVTALID